MIKSDTKQNKNIDLLMNDNYIIYKNLLNPETIEIGRVVTNSWNIVLGSNGKTKSSFTTYAYSCFSGLIEVEPGSYIIHTKSNRDIKEIFFFKDNNCICMTNGTRYNPSDDVDGEHLYFPQASEYSIETTVINSSTVKITLPAGINNVITHIGYHIHGSAYFSTETDMEHVPYIIAAQSEVIKCDELPEEFVEYNNPLIIKKNNIDAELLEELQNKYDSIIISSTYYTEIQLTEDDYEIIPNAYAYFNTVGGELKYAEYDTWRYIKVPCIYGYQYEITTCAGQNARPWLLFDINDRVLDESEDNSTVSIKTETMQVNYINAAYLIINSRVAEANRLKIIKQVPVEQKTLNPNIIIPSIDTNTIKQEILSNINLNIGNILYGKTLCCVGDSITYGADMDSPGIALTSPIEVYQWNNSQLSWITPSQYLKTYGYQIAERNNMVFYNGGISGSTMQGLSDKYGFSLENGRYTLLPDNIHYLTIFFGWNDTAYGNLGTIDDQTNESYYGGYNTVLPYLINKYPYTKIGLIVPFGCDIGHRQAVRDLGNKFGLGVFDTYKELTPVYYDKEESVGISSSIANFRRSIFQAKGAHPGYEGHKYLSTMIEAWLRSL